MEALDITPIKYVNGKLLILDQTKLPEKEVYTEIRNKEDMREAICRLKLRGAPAIGVGAAYGLYVSVRDFNGKGNGTDSGGRDGRDMEGFAEELQNARDHLITARPTAVNLSWALDRMCRVFEEAKPKTVGEAKRILFEEAEKIRKEDEASCRAMGEYGLSLLKPGMGILTHCNAGTIATAKYGTCLAPVYLGQERGYGFRVFADETRPLLQGARLTAWELGKAGVDVTLICDNMASIVMNNGWIDAVVVGCDRMAANGDGANKIGTSGVAILAKEYGIPFYMFAPSSTIDLDTPTGSDIKIELRGGDEIYKMWYEKPMAPEGVKTYNPAFDVTPAGYMTAVITEKGIVRPPYKENLAKLFK